MDPAARAGTILDKVQHPGGDDVRVPLQRLQQPLAIRFRAVDRNLAEPRGADRV